MLFELSNCVLFTSLMQISKWSAILIYYIFLLLVAAGAPVFGIVIVEPTSMYTSI